MMDCYFHHYEIMTSKTSAPEGIEDAKLGFALAKEVLSRDLSEYNEENAVKSAIASVARRQQLRIGARRRGARDLIRSQQQRAVSAAQRRGYDFDVRARRCLPRRIRRHNELPCRERTQQAESRRLRDRRARRAEDGKNGSRHGKTLAQLLRRKLARKGDAGIHRRNL